MSNTVIIVLIICAAITINTWIDDGSRKKQIKKLEEENELLRDKFLGMLSGVYYKWNVYQIIIEIDTMT